MKSLLLLLLSTPGWALSITPNGAASVASQAISPASVTATTVTATSSLYWGTAPTVSTGNSAGSLTLDPSATLTAQNASLPTITSTLAVTGNQFSVGATTFAVVGGNVGVGTIVPSTQSLVHVETAGSPSAAGIYGGISMSRFHSGADNWRGGLIGNYTGGAGTKDAIVIAVAGAGGGGSQINPANASQIKFYVGEDGKTGVGTASPATLLHMSSGTLTIDGTAGGFQVDGSTFNVLSSGRVGVGNAAPTYNLQVGPGPAGEAGTAQLVVTGPNQTVGSTNYNIAAYANDSSAIVDRGASLGLGGAYSGAVVTDFGSMSCRKENGTNADASGYCVWATQRQVGGIVEKMRLTSVGSLGIGTNAPGSVAALVVSSATGTSPAATFSPNLSSNTVTAAMSGTFTQTSMLACIAGSTRTLTLPTNVGSVLVLLNATVSVNSLAAVIASGVLVDGGYVNGETATRAIVAPLEAVSTDGTNVSFTALVTGLSAATHSFCWAPFVSAGTGTIDSTNSVATLTAIMLP